MSLCCMVGCGMFAVVHERRNRVTAIWWSAVVGEKSVLHFNQLPVTNNEKDTRDRHYV
jgi:hypothetical protein